MTVLFLDPCPIILSNLFRNRLTYIELTWMTCLWLMKILPLLMLMLLTLVFEFVVLEVRRVCLSLWDVVTFDEKLHDLRRGCVTQLKVQLLLKIIVDLVLCLWPCFLLGYVFQLHSVIPFLFPGKLRTTQCASILQCQFSLTEKEKNAEGTFRLRNRTSDILKTAGLLMS